MERSEDEKGIGVVVSVGGSRAAARLVKPACEGGRDRSRLTIGRMIAIRTDASRVIGVITSLAASPGSNEPDGSLVAEIDMLGEIRMHGTPEAFFQRGVSDYPTIGDPLAEVESAELALIHRIAGGATIDVGRLQLDASIPAYVNFDELLQKHFAVLGTTGVGKSTGVSLILNEILKRDSGLRIFSSIRTMNTAAASATWRS